VTEIWARTRKPYIAPDGRDMPSRRVCLCYWLACWRLGRGEQASMRQGGQPEISHVIQL
jgi:hypothetical protein